MPIDGNAASSIAPEDIELIVRGTARAVREFVASELVKRDKRITELEQKLQSFELRREVADGRR
jgi:hypothetical protein